MPAALLVMLLVHGPARAAESGEDDGAEDNGEVHAPPPAPAPPPEPPPPEAPPAPPAGWEPAQGEVVVEAPAYQGLYVQVGLLGGALVGGGINVVSPQGLGIDLTAGPRLGAGADLHANLVGMGGLSWTGGRKVQHGLFLRGGATVPGPEWFEVFAAGGYALRAPVGHGTWMGMDLGGGWMVVQELPDHYPAWPGMAYLRAVMDIATSARQRGG